MELAKFYTKFQVFTKHGDTLRDMQVPGPQGHGSESLSTVKYTD